MNEHLFPKAKDYILKKFPEGSQATVKLVETDDSGEISHIYANVWIPQPHSFINLSFTLKGAPAKPTE